MYIKLTRLNGVPIWLNGAYIVTIEPRKDGGAIVVPMGDGLDYDVKESPEHVLAMIEGKVQPAGEAPEAEKPKDAEKPKEAEAPSATDVPAPEEKPAKKRRTTKRTKKAATTVEIPAEQLERLTKMAPGSLKKLQNTLTTQFQIAEADVDTIVAALVEKGIVTLDRDHVIWA